MNHDPLYNDIAEAYDRWVSAAGEVLADPTLTDLIGPVAGDRICAVGCGAGRETRLLAKLGATVTGIDLSDALLAIAREREASAPLGIAYRHDDAHTLATLDDASFEGAVCYMALMDIPGLALALGAIARVLVPGGWFVFVITHPCFKPPAYGELVDHGEGTVRRVVGKYFEEGAWDGPGKNTVPPPIEGLSPHPEHLCQHVDLGGVRHRGTARTSGREPGVAGGSAAPLRSVQKGQPDDLRLSGAGAIFDRAAPGACLKHRADRVMPEARVRITTSPFAHGCPRLPSSPRSSTLDPVDRRTSTIHAGA